MNQTAYDSAANMVLTVAPCMPALESAQRAQRIAQHVPAVQISPAVLDAVLFAQAHLIDVQF